MMANSRSVPAPTGIPLDYMLDEVTQEAAALSLLPGGSRGASGPFGASNVGPNGASTSRHTPSASSLKPSSSGPFGGGRHSASVPPPPPSATPPSYALRKHHHNGTAPSSTAVDSARDDEPAREDNQSSVSLHLRLAEMRREVDALKRGVPAVDRKVVGAVVRQLENEFATATDAENQRLRKELHAAREACSRAQEQWQAAESKLSQAEAKCESLQDDLHRANQLNEDLKGALSARTGRSPGVGESVSTAYETKIFELTHKLQQAQESQEQERAGIAQVKTLWREVITKLKAENESLMQENSSLKANRVLPSAASSALSPPASTSGISVITERAELARQFAALESSSSSYQRAGYSSVPAAYTSTASPSSSSLFAHTPSQPSPLRSTALLSSPPQPNVPLTAYIIDRTKREGSRSPTHRVPGSATFVSSSLHSRPDTATHVSSDPPASATPSLVPLRTSPHAVTRPVTMPTPPSVSSTSSSVPGLAPPKKAPPPRPKTSAPQVPFSVAPDVPAPVPSYTPTVSSASIPASGSAPLSTVPSIHGVLSPAVSAAAGAQSPTRSAISTPASNPNGATLHEQLAALRSRMQAENARLDAVASSQQ